MKNELLTIGNITIYGYGLMIAIGVISAYLMSEFRAKRNGLDENHIFPLLIWGVLSGIIGAKLLYYITIIDEIIADPSLVIKNISDGFVVYGGIIAGILAGYIYCRVKKLEFWKYLDIVVPSIALAQGFGRIGCFLAGCCYGRETTSWCAITFTNSSYAPNGVPLVPTQLISSGLDFLHFAILVWLSGKNKIPGRISALYLIFYSIGRFIFEFFRGDLVRGSVGALSTSQFISIFVLLFGIGLFIVKSRQKKDEKAEENK